MKKMLLCILLMGLLTGCADISEHEYVVVQPHDEDYEVAIDSGKLSVDSYLSLKNALLNLVEDGVEEGTIQVKGYSGNLQEDLGQAVYEVSQADPLGAFAVEYMSYECYKIVSYYEVQVHIAFRRTPEEVESIHYITDDDSITGLVYQAINDFAPVLRVRVPDYQEVDIQSTVENVCFENPELLTAIPEIQVEAYPDTGSQRILEITFLYGDEREELAALRAQCVDQAEKLSVLYGSDVSQTTSARRFYDRIARDAVLVEGTEDTALDSAYAALVNERATSLGYAQAYRMLLMEREIACSVVAGTYSGAEHYWCLVSLEGREYYVDPSLRILEPDTDAFLLGTTELLALGYESEDENLPYIELLPTEKPAAFADPGAPAA